MQYDHDTEESENYLGSRCLPHIIFHQKMSIHSCEFMVLESERIETEISM